MKRKNEEIFEDGDGHLYQAFETYLNFPKKCQLCCFHTKRWGCEGNVNLIGECCSLKEEIEPIELIFCEVPKTI